MRLQFSTFSKQLYKDSQSSHKESVKKTIAIFFNSVTLVLHLTITLPNFTALLSFRGVKIFSHSNAMPSNFAFLKEKITPKT